MNLYCATCEAHLRRSWSMKVMIWRRSWTTNFSFFMSTALDNQCKRLPDVVRHNFCETLGMGRVLEDLLFHLLKTGILTFGLPASREIILSWEWSFYCFFGKLFRRRFREPWQVYCEIGVTAAATGAQWICCMRIIICDISSQRLVMFVTGYLLSSVLSAFSSLRSLRPTLYRSEAWKPQPLELNGFATYVLSSVI